MNLLTNKSPEKSTLRVLNGGVDVVPSSRLVGVQSALALPSTKVMQGLQNSDISTVIAVTLILSIDAAIVIFRPIDGQVQLDIRESGFPGSNSWVALADFCKIAVSEPS